MAVRGYGSVIPASPEVEAAVEARDFKHQLPMASPGVGDVG